MAAGFTLPATSTGVSSIDSSACTDPVLSQPFLSAKDNHWYTLMPGESADGSFTGEGWTFGGGASIVPSTINGQSGTSLDLPSTAYAISPAICVNSAYPTARGVVRNVTGAEGIQFYVSYQDTPTWLTPKGTGQLHGAGTAWTLAAPTNLQPVKATGWQIVRFVFVAGGKTSEFQLSQFWVDPRMKS